MSLRKAARNARKATGYGLDYPKNRFVAQNIKIENFDTPQQKITMLPDTVVTIDEIKVPNGNEA